MRLPSLCIIRGAICSSPWTMTSHSFFPSVSPAPSNNIIPSRRVTPPRSRAGSFLDKHESHHRSYSYSYNNYHYHSTTTSTTTQLQDNKGIEPETTINSNSNSNNNNNSNSNSNMTNTLEADLDWNDRIGLQSQYNLSEKGWRVAVDWRSTPYGAGVFSKQDIPKGTILRRGVIGVNLKEFASVADIDDFCGCTSSTTTTTTSTTSNSNSNSTDGSWNKAKLEYVKDYLWGFHKDADDRGYVDDDENDDSDKNGGDQRFFGMWVPGNGLNHNETPNTVYRSTPDGIDLVALVDICTDDELTDDYRRHGKASPWLKDFARIHNVTLNFCDCNDFV